AGARRGDRRRPGARCSGRGLALQHRRRPGAGRRRPGAHARGRGTRAPEGARPVSWQLAAFLMVSVALVLGFAWYERSRPSSRVLALVATLVAMAVLGRLAFAPLPNVKPATTDVILFAGFVLGAAPGFVTGAITALVSNFFISQGSWTPWQMAAWGIVGLFGAALARVAGRELGRWPLAIACALAGLGFGAVMNTYQLTFAATPDTASWIAISGQSLPYDLAHAIGNFVFCLALGPAFIRA